MPRQPAWSSPLSMQRVEASVHSATRQCRAWHPWLLPAQVSTAEQPRGRLLAVKEELAQELIADPVRSDLTSLLEIVEDLNSGLWH